MRLYYMTQLETLERFILPDQQIRVSTFDKVNDPFELLGAIKGGKLNHQDFAWLRDHWTNTIGFICFSDNFKSPLMWAHYANNHTGVCLGIEVSNKKLLQMNYRANRSAVNFDFKKFENAADEELMEKIISTKFKEWEYEREWRLLCPLLFNPKDNKPEFFFEQFTPDFELREVILGARCDRMPLDIQHQIFGVTAPVQIKRVRPAFESFSMVSDKRYKPVSVSPLGSFSKSEINLETAERFARARQANRELKKGVGR